MGVFSVSLEIAKITERPKFHRFDRLLVDTGSEMTWIAAGTLRKLGIAVRKKDQPFVMANGQTVTRDIGYALVRCGEFETVDEVVFAQNGDLQLLGSHTLEGFNAVVDPKRKRLVSAGPMPAAAVPANQTAGIAMTETDKRTRDSHDGWRH